MLPHEFQEYIVKVMFVIFATFLMCMRVGRANLAQNLEFENSIKIAYEISESEKRH